MDCANIIDEKISVKKEFSSRSLCFGYKNKIVPININI